MDNLEGILKYDQQIVAADEVLHPSLQILFTSYDCLIIPSDVQEQI